MVRNVKFDNKGIASGVPEGSIFGSLLFLIYMNEINKSSSKVCFHLFADDS